MDQITLLSSVFDALPIGVVLLDENADVVLYNRAEERLAGRKRESVIGRSFFKDVAPCTNIIGLGTDFQARVADGALHRSVSFRFPRPFVEKPRDVHLLLEALQIQGRSYGLLVVEDVSAARAVERTKDYLVRMLAHDMNSPLTILALAFDLLRPADDDGLWARARSASRRMRDMVVNLFDITRLHTSDVPTRIRTQNIVPVLGASFALARGLADPQGVDMQVLSPPSLLMDCDAELLRRAIDNLLDNAIRYSPPKARVILRAATEGAQLVIQVEDDGPGISPEAREALFYVFTRGDSLEDDLGHHGLGLAFVDLVARQHGGSVSVECPSQGGSVFTLRLPLETPDLKVLLRPSNVDPSAPS